MEDGIVRSNARARDGRGRIKVVRQQRCATDTRRTTDGDSCKPGAHASKIGRNDTRDRRGGHGRGRNRGGSRARARAVRRAARRKVHVAPDAERCGRGVDGRTRRDRRRDEDEHGEGELPDGALLEFGIGELGLRLRSRFRDVRYSACFSRVTALAACLSSYAASGSLQ